ncbi:hypothetical protein HNP99_001003 [Flavobacterium sp. 28A]|uniref:hypothetical protein n=1 Tax=Flavobacterium sp. 28A TaxID=2735895 RepID=UPI00156E4686|nr:hypothetical protein [Flavobacterium sp. 28A]NRT14659.1 hypothetical protein [Flavobacterium sp. 28A]
MGKLNIQRTNEFNNRVRHYRIYIDNKKVGTIENGENKDFEIEEGKHVIEAKIDWCGSPKVHLEIKNGEIKSLKVGGFKYGKWLIPISLVFILLSFLLEYLYDFEYTIFLVYPVLLLMVYYLTFGRNKYLTLTSEI